MTFSRQNDQAGHVVAVITRPHASWTVVCQGPICTMCAWSYAVAEQAPHGFMRTVLIPTLQPCGEPAHPEADESAKYRT